MWREYGRAWQPSYPHLALRCGNPVQRPDPRLAGFFPTDGFLFGAHLGWFCEFERPDISLFETRLSSRSASCSASCSACFAPALLHCEQCCLEYCAECWQQQPARSRCSAHAFCTRPPEYCCAQRHPLCEQHRDFVCQVCSSALAESHCAQHSHAALGVRCSCGKAGVALCLNCSASFCADCEHTCDQPRPLETFPEPDLQQWQSFATLYSFACRQLSLDSAQAKFHFERVLEFIDFMLIAYIQDLGSSVEVFSVETLGPTRTLETTISVEWLEERFCTAEQSGVASCQLLSNTDRASPEFGQLAMACLWFDGRWSFHWLAKQPRDLLKLMHEAYCAEQYFPLWFLQQTRPALVAKAKDETTSQ